MGDLFKLTNSKTREKILLFFYTNRDKKYYLRELERILSLSVGNIRRELIFLEKMGLFKREKMGNQVYYFLNQDSPLFEGVESIIAVSGRINSRKILKTLKKNEEIKEKAVFITKDDLNSLIYRISELENILTAISKDIPKKSLNKVLELKEKTEIAKRELVRVKRR